MIEPLQYINEKHKIVNFDYTYVTARVNEYANNSNIE